MLSFRPNVTIVELPIINGKKTVTKGNKEQRQVSYETRLGHYMPSDNVLESETGTKRLYPSASNRDACSSRKWRPQTSIVFPLSTTLTPLLQKFLDLISLPLPSSSPKSRPTRQSPPQSPFSILHPAFPPSAKRQCNRSSSPNSSSPNAPPRPLCTSSPQTTPAAAPPASPGS